MDLFFDTETSGFHSNKVERGSEQQAWAMQLAMILCDEETVYATYHAYVRSDHRTCHPGAFGVHGIRDDVVDKGVPSGDVWAAFEALWMQSDRFICHNFDFDIEFITNLYYYGGAATQDDEDSLREHPFFCTMKSSTEFCQIPKKRGHGYKWPTLDELYGILFGGKAIPGAHDARNDVHATKLCYYELKKRGIV